MSSLLSISVWSLGGEHSEGILVSRVPCDRVYKGPPVGVRGLFPLLLNTVCPLRDKWSVYVKYQILVNSEEVTVRGED